MLRFERFLVLPKNNSSAQIGGPIKGLETVHFVILMVKEIFDTAKNLDLFMDTIAPIKTCHDVILCCDTGECASIYINAVAIKTKIETSRNFGGRQKMDS